MHGRLVKGAAVLTLVAVLVSGCETIKRYPKTAIGAVGGATVGGLIAGAAAANPAGVAAGVIGGLLLGGLVGNLLDERDRKLQAHAAATALESTPSGKSVPWKNPDTGHSGTVKPTKTYQSASGAYCRDYTTTVQLEGKQERATGKACRQPNGTWRVA